jgi:hypothetical protein
VAGRLDWPSFPAGGKLPPSKQKARNARPVWGIISSPKINARFVSFPTLDPFGEGTET